MSHIEPQASLADSLSASATLRADGLWEGVLQVQGMTCGACAIEIEAFASRIPGVQAFTVNPALGLCKWVATDPQIILSADKLARKRGYALGGVLDQNVDQLLKNQQRRLLLRLVVAVLCAMQVMMYSAPEYLYSVDEIGTSAVQLLRWAQWVLCLPILLFCAQPFYKSAWFALKNRSWAMDQLVSGGLLLAFFYSAWHITAPDQSVWFDSVSMLVSFLLGVRYWLACYQSNTLKFLAKLVPDLPKTVLRQTEGGWVLVAVGELKEGEQIRLLQGEVCPVDCTLVDAQRKLWFDEAMRTGELIPVLKTQAQLVAAGSRLLSEQAVLCVQSRAIESSFSRLGLLLQSALASKPKRSSVLDKWTPWFAAGVLLCASLSALAWWSAGAGVERVLQVFISVLLVTCPCALALAWPLVYLQAFRFLAKHGVLLKHPEALGVLTEVDWSFLPNAIPLNAALDQDYALGLVLKVALTSHHPLARSLVLKLIGSYSPHMDDYEVMNVVDMPGCGISAVMRENSSQSCFFLRLGSAQFCNAPEVESDTSMVYLSVVCHKRGEGQGVQPFTPLLQLRVRLSEVPFQSSSLGEMSKQGKVVVLSGDLNTVVGAWRPELKFSERLGEMTPERKMRWIQALQTEGHVVAMCGDGLNDAAAFAQADVSIAVAGAATLSSSNADILLTQPSLDIFPLVLSIAKRTHTVGQLNMVWALLYNAVGIPLAAMGLLTPGFAALGMGLSSLVVVLNAMRVSRALL